MQNNSKNGFEGSLPNINQFLENQNVTLGMKYQHAMVVKWMLIDPEEEQLNKKINFIRNLYSGHLDLNITNLTDQEMLEVGNLSKQFENEVRKILFDDPAKLCGLKKYFCLKV